ncbi:MAG: primosomal protein N' [Candidatus Omnitrophica bacterium]|nr:primosomal protein N' [Candidatus Omnitrophota bacterium]
MLFAKIVVGLPVEGPFDYIVPDSLNTAIKVGSRVWVNFANRKVVGYVVGLTHKSAIKQLKQISGLVDFNPILDKNSFLLAKEISSYYGCSLGQAIETIYPDSLRRGKPLQNIIIPQGHPQLPKKEVILIHDLSGFNRWEVYLEHSKQALKNKEAVVIILPDIKAVLRVKELVKEKLGIEPTILYRNQPNELEEWSKIKSGKTNFVIGTRSGIFAPMSNLGLIIIDDEHDYVYKQEQSPHYNAKTVALMRTEIDKTKLILGSSSPSLESYYLSKKDKLKLQIIPRKLNFPQVHVIDTRRISFEDKKRKNILTKFLEDAVYSSLLAKGKTLLFLNRRGFATYAFCHNCAVALKCPRCNISLVYHFKENLLSCHHCNYKITPPKICPNCNSGYIKFAGFGTEKIESELSRIFPQARIKLLDDASHVDIQNADIFIATSTIFKFTKINFDLVGVLAIDDTLNRMDFRSGEKAFSIISGLVSLTENKIIIQSSFPGHYCLQAFLKKDPISFYEQELSLRKELDYPPYKHMILVKLRSEIEEKSKTACLTLFDKLRKSNKEKAIKIVSVNAGMPAKLRGKFYWQIMILAGDAKEANKFLKNQLADFLHSGIIVTIDVDPV